MPRAIVKYSLTPEEKEKLSILTPTELKVILMRLGLSIYERCHSFREIAKALGFTHHESIRNIEKRALKKLRNGNDNS